jgi:hypothetical protein
VAVVAVGILAVVVQAVLEQQHLKRSLRALYTQLL